MQGLEIIKEFHNTTPKTPGVYRMLDKDKNVLYVGKAKNLYNRIKNYTDTNGLSERIKQMIFHTESMEIITTETETGALILEQNLIKQLNPKYNILLKDDKSYPYLTISKDEFPKIGKFRGQKNSSQEFFGPFPSGLAVNEAIKNIQTIFKIRTCNNTQFKNRSSTCLLYQIKKCSGPCIEKISQTDYMDQVKKTTAFLNGHNQIIIDYLSNKMNTASEIKDYETAIIYRNQISYINKILKQTELTGINGKVDVICLIKHNDIYIIEVFFARQSIICGNFSYFPKITHQSTEPEILEEFIEHFYTNHQVPDTILTNIETIDKTQEIEDTLASIKGTKVEIRIPQKGDAKKLLETTIQNAIIHAENKYINDLPNKKHLNELKDLLTIPTNLNRVDVFDNSHTFGTNKIGAMIVVGINGFEKKLYRKYNIKADIKGDDYKMMEETLTRRYTRAIDENTLPDLIVVDGGKGQLDVAHHVIRRLNLNTPILAIAKGENRNQSDETLYMFGHDPIYLKKPDSRLFFLERIRDEAHHFAISSHRIKRANDTFKSELDTIEGIGAKKKKSLLNYFGSVQNIIDANIDELSNVDGINKTLAEKIYKNFH